MDIFTYFQADHANMEKKLNELTENYSQLSAAQVHDKALRIFDAISAHFEKQEELMLSSIKDIESLQPVIKEGLADRKNIMDEIEDAVNIHIDDPDFNKQMKRILKLIENHVKFSDHDLYDKIKDQVPEEVLEKINDRLAQTILS